MSFRDPIAWEQSLPVRPSSPAWVATIKAFYGTALSAAELALFHELSGGREPTPGGDSELECIVGRRGGKSETIARVAVFEALHGAHEVALAPGQLGLIAVISPLREQSAEILNYAKGLAKLRGIKVHVLRDTIDTLEFRHNIAIRVMTADAVNVSGPTLVCCVRDERAKFPGPDAAMPETEIENSLRPALAPVHGAPRRRLIGIGSAYVRDCEAHKCEQACFGKADAPVLVVRGNTQTFNPHIDVDWLDKERARVGDVIFAREYEGVWQDALTEGWFGEATIARSIDHDRPESPPHHRHSYSIAIDAAFRGDAFALAIAHGEYAESGAVTRVLDLVQSWAAPKGETQSVEQRAADVARQCNRYRRHVVYCDQFASVPLAAVFARHGVTLVEKPWTAQSKPAKFREIRDAMADNRVRLPANAALIREFHAIQGKLQRSGSEQIEAKFGHDDLVSAAVLALSEITGGAGRVPVIHPLSESKYWRPTGPFPRFPVGSWRK